ncbi:MAG: hypothetical protein AAB501_04155 [Patescibacteria group bacterium]
MFLYILISSLIFLGGCAASYQLPVVQNPQVMPVKDHGRERLRQGNLLFVNRSPVWRDVLIFNGHHYKDDLLVCDDNGYPALAANPIAVFEMGPSDSPRDAYPQYRTKLMGGFYPGQEYTLLVISKDMANQMVGPVQIYPGEVATRPASDVYTYIPYLGTMAGQHVREVVNDVVYLPDRNPREYRGTNTLNMTIDVNLLLQRGIHKIRNP